MGHPIPSDSIGAPARWMLVFDRSSELWWANLIPGRHKHVRAFGYVHDCDTYVFYDVHFARTTLQLARGECARRLMVEWTVDADVLRFPATPQVSGNYHWWLPLLCTTTIAHLIGLPGGTLLPSSLYRQCLRRGAVPVGDHHEGPRNSATPSRPDACAVDVDGLPATVTSSSV